jgi:hypothetical protein
LQVEPTHHLILESRHAWSISIRQRKRYSRTISHAAAASATAIVVSK